jgi:hypothetical protein
MASRHSTRAKTPSARASENLKSTRRALAAEKAREKAKRKELEGNLHPIPSRRPNSRVQRQINPLSSPSSGLGRVARKVNFLATPSPKISATKQKTPSPNNPFVLNPSQGQEEPDTQRNINQPGRHSDPIEIPDLPDVPATSNRSKTPDHLQKGNVSEIPSSPPLAPYDVEFSLRFLVNKTVKATPATLKQERFEFNLAKLDEAFEPCLQQHVEPLKLLPNQTTITCAIKAFIGVYTKGSEIKVIDDFGITNQEMLLETIDSIKKRRPIAQIKLVVDYRVSFNLKEREKLLKAQNTISSPASEPYSEEGSRLVCTRNLNSETTTSGSRVVSTRGRSQQLLNNAAIERDSAMMVGSSRARLERKYKCRDESCRHMHQLCYVDHTENPPYHIQLSDSDIRKWANSINAGVATLEEPSKHLYKEFWERRGCSYRNPIVHGSRHSTQAQLSEVRSGMAGIMNMSEKMMEMAMFRQLQDNLEREEDRQLRREKKQQARERREELEEDDDDSLCRKRLQRARSLSLRGKPPRSEASQPFEEPHLQDDDAGYPKRPFKPTSSPIRPDEDDANVRQEFFQWKIDNIEDERVVDRWKKAYEAAIENDWSMADLRSLTSAVSTAYQEAVAAGLTSGMMRAIVAGLKNFKDYIRKEGLD